MQHKAFRDWLQSKRARLQLSTHTDFLAHLRERGLDVSLTTLKYWMNGDRQPAARHLLVLFDLFACPRIERERISALVIEERAARGAA